jgi:hypothetical protein
MLKPVILLVCVLLLQCGASREEERARAAVAIKPASEQIMQVFHELRKKHFPELSALKLSIKPTLQPDVYFATDVVVGTVFNEPAAREYVFYLNPSLAKQMPPALALEGILVHELEHFKDYMHMSAFDLAGLYLGVTYSDSYASRYERATDLKAMEKGYSEGIKAYRVWIYSQLKTEEELALKKSKYYTPEEIDAYLEKKKQSR